MDYEEIHHKKMERLHEASYSNYKELLDRIISETEAIDENTPAMSQVEPVWWVEMMDLQRLCVQLKKTVEK